jgi:hypothetical protein
MRLKKFISKEMAPDEKISKHNGFKAKIMRLHANRPDRINVGSG